jgi:hypothetical protein
VEVLVLVLDNGTDTEEDWELGFEPEAVELDVAREVVCEVVCEVLVEAVDVVDTGTLVVTELPGVIDDVEDVVEITVLVAVELVVAVKAAEIQEHTAPAEFFAARAVTRPQALVAHARASMTIAFDTAGTH